MDVNYYSDLEDELSDVAPIFCMYWLKVALKASSLTLILAFDIALAMMLRIKLASFLRSAVRISFRRFLYCFQSDPFSVFFVTFTI